MNSLIFSSILINVPLFVRDLIIWRLRLRRPRCGLLPLKLALSPPATPGGKGRLGNWAVDAQSDAPPHNSGRAGPFRPLDPDLLRVAPAPRPDLPDHPAQTESPSRPRARSRALLPRC